MRVNPARRDVSVLNPEIEQPVFNIRSRRRPEEWQARTVHAICPPEGGNGSTKCLCPSRRTSAQAEVAMAIGDTTTHGCGQLEEAKVGKVTEVARVVGKVENDGEVDTVGRTLLSSGLGGGLPSEGRL